MGVLNLGPESFYKGSVVNTEKLAGKRAVQMVEEGAEFLDLGAVSTAPGVGEISETDELSRLLPILKTVLDVVDVPISIDTFRSEVADKALNMGAHIINDVSGFLLDKNMVGILHDHDVPSIIMATKAKIGDPLTMPDIVKALNNSIKLSEEQNYDSKKIIIDPAIGRWVPEKTYQFNLDIIKQLKDLMSLNRPILVGISRKSFVHEILNRPDPKDRLAGTLSATAVSVINGAHIVRTHDVAVTSDVVRIAELLRE
jgi:dihydropteroate synthase